MAQNKLREQRVRQLKEAELAISTLKRTLHDVRSQQARENELASHLDGFYQEINKLAKGKTLVSVTDLVVGQANDIIRDSKFIIHDDTYLDRVKEFVPAGDNPVYPDVLLVIRAVQQSLQRSRARTEQRKTKISSLLFEATTIHGALICYVEYQISSPMKAQVEKVVDGNVAERWFPYSSGYYPFDFERLDRFNVDVYLSENRDGEESEDEELEDEELEDEEPVEEERDDDEAEE